MRVDVIELKKHFGQTKAVDGITFHFESGHVFGFVGPNGAGKTTTMRVINSLEEPSSGDVYIDGMSVTQYPEEGRRLMGFVPDSLPAFADVTVHEYLDFYARAQGLRGKQRRLAVDSIEEFTNTGVLRDKLLKDLSKGMKQRVSLGRALVHDPPVLVLDEPAAGLDPRARVELRELLGLLATQKKAILISSHILTELTEICNGAVIIERGKILATGTIDQLMGKATPHQRVMIRAMEPVDQLQQRLLELPQVEQVQLAEAGVEVEMPEGDEQMAELLAQLVGRGLRIVEFRPMEADLEDIFMSVTRGEVQ